MSSQGLDAFLRQTGRNTSRYGNKKSRRQEWDEDEQGEDMIHEAHETERSKRENAVESDISDEDIDGEDVTVKSNKPRTQRDGELMAIQRLHAQGVTLDTSNEHEHDEQTITGKKRMHSDIMFAETDNDVMEKFNMDDENARPEPAERDRWLESLAQASIQHHEPSHYPQTERSNPSSADSSSYDSMDIRSLCEKLASCLEETETVQAAMKRVAPHKNRNRYKKPRRRDALLNDTSSEPELDTETIKRNKAQLSLITDLTSALIRRFNMPQVFSLNKSQLLKMS